MAACYYRNLLALRKRVIDGQRSAIRWEFAWEKQLAARDVSWSNAHARSRSRIRLVSSGRDAVILLRQANNTCRLRAARIFISDFVVVTHSVSGCCCCSRGAARTPPETRIPVGVDKPCLTCNTRPLTRWKTAFPTFRSSFLSCGKVRTFLFPGRLENAMPSTCCPRTCLWERRVRISRNLKEASCWITRFQGSRWIPGGIPRDPQPMTVYIFDLFPN